MAIALPSTPAPSAITPVYNSVRSTFRSPLTGKAQTNSRPGAYFGVDVQLPPMRDWGIARPWISRLIQGVESTVEFRWWQPAANVGAPGSPLVNGAGQVNKLINADGFTASYAWKEGQFFSLITSSTRRETKMLTADGAANGAGVGTLSFMPALRASPADNAALEFATPMIEGILVDSRLSWSYDIASTYGLSFRIEEVG